VYAAKVQPATQVAACTGNTYCGSVHASLLSLLSNVTPTEALVGKRIVLFSYGSGLASTMLAIRVAKPVDDIVRRADIMARLATTCTPAPVATYLQVRMCVCVEPDARAWLTYAHARTGDGAPRGPV
jgi:hydroxymethylglutaryl-CoA synthase